MKRLLFLLLLLTTAIRAQVSTGNEAYFDYGIQVNPAALQIPATTPYIGTFGTDGTQGKVLPENMTLNILPHPINYTAANTTLGAQIKGIDDKIGTIVQTTAGVFNRIKFTGDQTTISAGTFFLTSATSAGTVPTASPTPLVNNDDEKKYFAKDLIGNAFPAMTKFPAGTYAGQLTVRVSPNSAAQRYTVELYKTDTNGNPISSGVSGASVGSLGVTVVTILDSGNINLADNALTGIPVQGALTGELTINVGERIRYHVSAAKVGTAGANITMEVFYGSSYNSYYDVPVTFDTNGIVNKSAVTGATTTDALNTLNTGKADDSNVVHKTGNEIKTGDLTVNNLFLPVQPLGSNPYKIKGFMGTDDNWSIYGDGVTTDRGIMVFEVGDNGLPFATDGQKFEFRYSASFSGVAKTPLTIDYNDMTFRGNFITDLTTGPLSQAVYRNGVLVAKIGSGSGTTGINGILQLYDTAGIENVRLYASGPSYINGGPLQISNLSGSGTRQVNATSAGDLVAGAVQPFKYVALLTQSGTNAPTATVLENTLGGTVVWTRVGTGDYVGTLSGAFPNSLKTVIFGTLGSSGGFGQSLGASYMSVNSVNLRTSNSGGNTDGALLSAQIEIRVYP